MSEPIQSIAQNNYILSNMAAKDLYVQSPLTTGMSGTSAYIGIEPSAQYNETVLWENTEDKLTRDLSWPQTLSESISSFTRVKFLYAGDGPYNPQWFEFDVNSNNSYTLTQSYTPQNHDYMFYRNAIFSLNGTSFNNETNYTLNYYGTTAMSDHNNVGYNKVSKIIGINRKQ